MRIRIYLALWLTFALPIVQSSPVTLQKGMPYVSARKALLKEHWKPLNVHAQDDYVPMGVEHELVKQRYREFDSCSVDNSSCVMRYRRNTECLTVFTIGERIKYMKVVDWSDKCPEELPHVPTAIAK